MAEEIIINLKIGGADQSVTTLGQLKTAIATLKKEQDGLKIGSEAFNKVQNDLAKAEQARIDIMKKTPSLFQERIKGAINESNSLRELKQQIKEYTAAVIAGEEGAAEKLAELKDKLEDVKDATDSFKGTGVEKLKSSMDLLQDSITNFDAEKFQIGLKGIGSAMKAIPILLIIEGIVFLLEKFGIMDMIVRVVTDAIYAFTDALGLTNKEAEKNTKSTIEGYEKQEKAVQQRYDTEIALAKASGKDVTELEYRKLKAVEDSIQKQVDAYKLLEFKKGELNEEEKKDYEDLQNELLDATRERLRKEVEARNNFNNKIKDINERNRLESYSERGKVLQEIKMQKDEEVKAIYEATNKLTKITVEDINKQYEAIQQIEQYYRKVENKQKAEWGKEDAAKRKSEKDKELAEQERLQKELLNQIKETQDQGILYLETEIKNRKLKKQDELRFERELAKFRKDIVLLDDKSTYTQRYAAEVEYKAKIKELDELEDQRKKDARIKTLQDQKIEQQIILENQESTIQYIRDARLKQLEAQNKIDLENFKGTENEKLLLLQKYTNDKLKIERDYQAEKQKIVIQEIQFVQQTANAFLNLASLLTKNQEQLKQIQKIQSLVAIAANTATAISNLVAVSFSSSSPDNIMTGGIAAYVKLATGIATITANMVQAKQLISSFEEGGYTGEGNPKDVSTNLGSKSYTYHKDEYVIPSRVLNTPQGSMLASQAESMRLGMTNPFPQIKGFFDGGFAARGMGASANNSMDQMRLMQDVLTSLPAPIVKVTDINKTQTATERAITVASL